MPVVLIELKCLQYNHTIVVNMRWVKFLLKEIASYINLHAVFSCDDSCHRR